MGRIGRRNGGEHVATGVVRGAWPVGSHGVGVGAGLSHGHAHNRAGGGDNTDGGADLRGAFHIVRRRLTSGPFAAGVGDFFGSRVEALRGLPLPIARLFGCSAEELTGSLLGNIEINRCVACARG